MIHKLQGELEIDTDRGVIYFHSSIEDMKRGFIPTILRICGLKIHQRIGEEIIDVSTRVKIDAISDPNQTIYGFGVSEREKYERNK